MAPVLGSVSAKSSGHKQIKLRLNEWPPLWGPFLGSQNGGRFVGKISVTGRKIAKVSIVSARTRQKFSCRCFSMVLHKIFACVVIRLAAWRIEFLCRIFWLLVVSSPTCLWWKRGPVGNFFAQVPQRSGQSSIGKLTCQNLRQYTVNQSPAQWPHTRTFPGQTKLVLQPRSSRQTSTKNQTTSNIVEAL